MKIVKLLILTLLTQLSFGQTQKDTLSMIEKTLSQYGASNPGCQLSVSKNGKLIYSNAVGMADLEHNIPLTTNSILEAGSVSKQFTAAAILLLEQQGKLSLDDDVRKYIPELPDYGTPIKLHHMLHHTSGLRDWGVISAYTGWPRGTKFYSNDDALEIISRQKGLNNKPGDEFIYSNSNYNLFAIIVERVSGLTLADFTKKYIFEPAEMTHTQWRDDPNKIVPNRAFAYSHTKNGYKTDMPNEYVYGNGGLLTTTEDLLKWNHFYLEGKLGNPSLLLKQTHTEPLNDTKKNEYAAGLYIKKASGWDNISHGGTAGGYRSYLEVYPQLNISIAVLSNTSQFSANVVSSSVAKIFMPDISSKEKVTKNPKQDSFVVLPEEKLNSYVGTYKWDTKFVLFDLTVKDKGLLLKNKILFKPVSENKFIAKNSFLEIYGDKGIYVNYSSIDTIHFTKLPSTNLIGKKLLEKEVRVFEGKYFSEEANSDVSIYQKNDILMIRLNPNVAYTLTPSYKDTFVVENTDTELRIIRDSYNEIKSFTLSSERAKNVEFKKI
ncbi:MAG: serine hydrolase domain-containing protein [Aequorivita sp.]